MPHMAQIRRGLPLSRSWFARLRSDMGGTLVESAFSIGILLTLLIGIIEGCLMVYSYHFISNAAREGTRYAMVRGSTWSQAPWSAGACASYSSSGCIASGPNIQDYVKSLAFPGIDASNIQVTPTWYNVTGGSQGAAYNAAGDVIQVKVTYQFPVSIPGLPQSTLSMSSTSQMVIAQ